jgi:hypothetical protein
MASLQFTDADRDERGFITAPAEPRSLADLLPRSADIRQDAKRQRWTRGELASLVVVGLCAAFVLIYAWATPTAPPAPPRAAPTTVATSQPTAEPTAGLATPVRLLAGFASPDGARLGQIEATRAITPVAHFGQDWIQADVAGSGRIWLRASDWPALAIVGPDLAPPTIAPAAPFMPAAATTAPAPPPCAEAGISGKMVQVCGDDSLDALQAQAKAKWIEQYGGNVGSGDIHPTPPPWRKP